MPTPDSEENVPFMGDKTRDSDQRTDRAVLVRRLQQNVVCGVLGFISSSLIFLTILLFTRLPTNTTTCTKPQVLPGQSFWPEIPDFARVFVDDKDWIDAGEIGDVLWHDLLPVGGGFVPIPWPRNYALPESAPLEGNPEQAELYATSSVHQLHCLATMRETIKSYSQGEEPLYSSGHAYHCLNYLRQGVLCAADTTLEYGHPVWNKEKTSMEYDFAGNGVVHQCRNWNTVKEFLVNHRTPDKQSMN
ncbi:hypothetical protein CCM_03474 [Cordyceps militaris CM01]|uniref:Tat pathway signal sequence n=1 Tax=Cordyceps militaris (strain CM01) TaxID=983644 RepID=G3JAZ0_CORMM|nr:uncharacterized protein CCM_03474 [Cordyceps militaris CM01]EGX95202.1 hypothetical protein CCM_03474 [Cordyceps militaris CM01]